MDLPSQPPGDFCSRRAQEGEAHQASTEPVTRSPSHPQETGCSVWDYDSSGRRSLTLSFPEHPYHTPHTQDSGKPIWLLETLSPKVQTPPPAASPPCGSRVVGSIVHWVEGPELR